tara:strand:+ start:1319 stop:2098 length:780 start_codon:yes stop_codon:yes gene_type:complete
MTLVMRLAGTTFANPKMPILANDSLINGGTLACLDFANPNCNPLVGQTAPSGTDFTNLKPNALLATSNTSLGYSGGGLDFTYVGTAASYYIELGNSEYELSLLATPPAAVAICWMKPDANSGNNGAAFQKIRGTSFGTTNQPLSITGGPTVLKASMNRKSAEVFTGDTSLVPHQVGVAFYPADRYEFFIDGTLHSTLATTDSVWADGSSTPLRLSGAPDGNKQFTGVIYRAYFENLALSGNTALSVIQADYAANSSRFT